MSLWDRFLAGFDTAMIIEMLLRMVIAAVLGGIVGIERSRRFKDAGVRTHSMVACSAALMMMISKYGFLDLLGRNGIGNSDPGRIAAGIVTGISFLGAGIIYRDSQRHSIKGLTTAAGIWCVAGIGMAAGSGMYFLAVFATVFVMLLQFIMHRYTIGRDKYTGSRVVIAVKDEPAAAEKLRELFRKWGILIGDADIERSEGCLVYTMDIKMQSKQSKEEISGSITTFPEMMYVKFLEQ